MATGDQPDRLPDRGVLGEIDAAFRDRLASAGRFESLPSGSHLCEQGQDHHALSVLVEGKLSVSCHAYGKKIHLADILPGETVGEMGVIDPQKSSATVVVAEGPARVWTIDGDEFDRFVQDNHEGGLQIYRALARELCRRIRHDSDAALRRAVESSEHFLDLDY